MPYSTGEQRVVIGSMPAVLSAPTKGQSRQSLVVISNDFSMSCGVQDTGDEDSVLCVSEEEYCIVLRSSRHQVSRQ